MKKILSLILVIMTWGQIAASNLAVQADSAYTADNFSLAADLYRQSIETDGASSIIYYNLGNAYYRMNDLGRAIVNYERALQLDPTNSDARTNLDFVNSQITDKPLDSGSFVYDTIDSVISSAHPDTWAWITFILFVIIIGCVLGYIFSSGVKIRKICFFGGIVLMFVTIGTAWMAWMSASRVNDHSYAIIVVPASQLSTTPREAVDPSEQAFLLHEGTKLEIVDSVLTPGSDSKRWYEVKVDNTHRAWINSLDIEKI